MKYVPYESELQLPAIARLIEKDLSEPYSVYTYRYFIHNWPQLCLLAVDGADNEIIGVIVCKADKHKEELRGYIGMLAVSKEYRKQRIGSTLVEMAVARMKEENAHEVVLETEETNQGALSLYQNLGFVRDKRLCRYYLNGVDAFRLKLRLR
ncbi:putative acyltransfersase [Phlyctochytrium arcticum]|nr:putative acyltransfersase [Phlyctochytrium arcticum]